jgi:membrane-associated protease RseP (regulator of RpoE activity)
MSFDSLGDRPGAPSTLPPVAPLVLEPHEEPTFASRRVNLPIILFLATCLTTFFAAGPIFAAALMLTLTCHEMGHFIQARRYRVPASLPYFIPMPIGPFGTMGAVIGMRGNMGSRKAVFDIGISGPLAGLVPALFFTVIGLLWSTVEPKNSTAMGLGDPLLFKILASWIFGPLPQGEDIYLHPLAYAGWVGIFITALNLFPIGQLDGGHILYALLRNKAQLVATVVLYAAVGAVIITHRYEWLMMLMLLMLMGPKHPPTANDDEPLGTGRTILGWLTLSFLIIGFTPVPFV